MLSILFCFRFIGNVNGKSVSLFCSKSTTNVSIDPVIKNGKAQIQLDRSSFLDSNSFYAFSHNYNLEISTYLLIFIHAANQRLTTRLKVCGLCVIRLVLRFVRFISQPNCKHFQSNVVLNRRSAQGFA